MAYALSHKTVRDKTTLYAVIQDKETSLFWDEVADLWVAEITDDCNLTLTESADKGVYTGNATFTPVNGGVYQISVYDSADAEYIMDTIEVYPSKTKTVLQIINAVQTELRMPNSAAITDMLSRLILAKMNTVLTILLPENNVFDHLKVQGSFTINSSRPFYRVNPVNVDFVDSITFLRKPDLTYVKQADSDIHFREMADSHNASLTYAAPVFYRISQRDHGFPIVEFTPAPDQAYIIAYEVLKAAKELTAATDYVPVPDVIKAGALMLMKQEMGRDATADQAIYSKALERASTTSANSNMKDFAV
jgi:hypothetical protein